VRRKGKGTISLRKTFLRTAIEVEAFSSEGRQKKITLLCSNGGKGKKEGRPVVWTEDPREAHMGRGG